MIYRIVTAFSLLLMLASLLSFIRYIAPKAFTYLQKRPGPLGILRFLIYGLLVVTLRNL